MEDREGERREEGMLFDTQVLGSAMSNVMPIEAVLECDVRLDLSVKPHLSSSTGGDPTAEKIA